MPNIVAEHQGLGGNRLGGGGQLFGIGRHLLRPGVHLGHSLIDLENPLGLLMGGGGDLFHQNRHLPRAVHHILGFRHHLVHLLQPVIDIADGPFNQVAGVSCRLSGTLGKIAHLIGNHGKTRALLPGPGGFHRRIQGEKIGLKGDRLDLPND